MKKAPDKSDPNPPPSDAAFEEQVFRGLLAEGYVIPETAEELQIAETAAVSAPPLPEKLRDPDEVLRRIKERIAGKEGKTIPFPLPQEPGVEEEFEELDRAARHGKTIATTIEQKMAENRRIADEDAEKGEPK